MSALHESGNIKTQAEIQEAHDLIIKFIREVTPAKMNVLSIYGTMTMVLGWALGETGEQEFESILEIIKCRMDGKNK